MQGSELNGGVIGNRANKRLEPPKSAGFFPMIPALPYRLFAILCVASLLIWWRVIDATLTLSLRSDAYTHISLVLPISVVLIVTEWKKRKWEPKPSFRAGSALVGFACWQGMIPC